VNPFGSKSRSLGCESMIKSKEAEFLKKNGYVYLELDKKQAIHMSLRLNASANEMLEKIAKAKQVTKSFLLREAIEDFLLLQKELNKEEILECAKRLEVKPEKSLSVRIHKTIIQDIDEIVTKYQLNRNTLFRYVICKLLEKYKSE